MHKIENKSLWKEEMSYGGDTWYMGRISDPILQNLEQVARHVFE